MDTYVKRAERENSKKVFFITHTRRHTMRKPFVFRVLKVGYFMPLMTDVFVSVSLMRLAEEDFVKGFTPSFVGPRRTDVWINKEGSHVPFGQLESKVIA